MKNIKQSIYELYDANKDGEVTIIDLLHVQAQVEPNCQFGKEIHMLAEEYSKIITKETYVGTSPNIIKRIFDKILDVS